MTNLQFYLDNFWRELQSGQDVQLQMECHAGQVWLSFHVHVAHPPPQQHHQRHHGPSRLRRRARIAEARAAANAVPKETVADDVGTAEKADSGQTETNKHNDDLPTSSAAQEAAKHPQPIHNTQLPSEQAVHWHICTPDVPDTFCPDRDYEAAAEVDRRNVPSLQSHNQNIPQLDGLTHDHDCINSPASFPRLSRVMNNSRWQSHIEAEEERRIEREKDLENIERMIQNHTGLL